MMLCYNIISYISMLLWWEKVENTHFLHLIHVFIDIIRSVYMYIQVLYFSQL